MIDWSEIEPEYGDGYFQSKRLYRRDELEQNER